MGYFSFSWTYRNVLDRGSGTGKIDGLARPTACHHPYITPLPRSNLKQVKADPQRGNLGWLGKGNQRPPCPRDI